MDRKTGLNLGRVENWIRSFSVGVEMGGRHREEQRYHPIVMPSAIYPLRVCVHS